MNILPIHAAEMDLHDVFDAPTEQLQLRLADLQQRLRASGGSDAG
jgi:hypothetical protein